MLCPQSPLNNVYPYSYPPIYPPHPNDPYFLPKEPYYPHLSPFGYNPQQFPRIPPYLTNSIPKDVECPQVSTTTPRSVCTSPKPSTAPPCHSKEVCCIYEDLLAIIEKMVQYLLQDSPACNIKFTDQEKLKIAEALNIIIKYLHMQCRNVNADQQYCGNKELNVEVSLILEDILSMLPIALLQSKCSKLELNNQLCCLLNIVKYIRETYGHIRGLCSIYKNLKEMFKPCIFVKDCDSKNYLSKENIRGYLLMDSLNLALYLVYKNNINENLAEKKHEIVDLWVDYLYKTQFLNCNEVCPAKVPLLNDVKATEELLTKLRKLFLYEYVLRLREKDPKIQGVDSVIAFCTKNCTCTFGLEGDYKISGLQKNKISLEELLVLVENHLKGKYNFKPTTECTPCCVETSVNEGVLPSICHQSSQCSKTKEEPNYPVTPLETLQASLGHEAPICSKPGYSRANLGVESPICLDQNLDLLPNLEGPVCFKPPPSKCPHPPSVQPNLGSDSPICSKPSNLDPPHPICPHSRPRPRPISSKPAYSPPNLGSEPPICSKPNRVHSPPDASICLQPPSELPNCGFRFQPHRSNAPNYQHIDLGSEAPICLDSPTSSNNENLSNSVPQPSDLNLGRKHPICPESSDLSANLGSAAPISMGYPRGRPRIPIGRESFEDCEIDYNNPSNLSPIIFPSSDDTASCCQFDQIRPNCTKTVRLPANPTAPICSKSPESIQASLGPSDLDCVIEDPVDLGHKLCNLDNVGIDYPKLPSPPIGAKASPNCPKPSMDVTNVYCDEFPLSKLHSGHLGSGYNILTSSEPIGCLGCGGGCGGGGKFPLDMDAYNVYNTEVTESKDVVCRKPAPNGRRCPYCTPYIRELDF